MQKAELFEIIANGENSGVEFKKGRCASGTVGKRNCCHGESARRENSYRCRINSFSHRDWTRALEITVTNYSHRIEINSPGALHNSMTIEKMLAGQCSIRNPIILEILRYYEYVDMRGM